MSTSGIDDDYLEDMVQQAKIIGERKDATLAVSAGTMEVSRTKQG